MKIALCNELFGPLNIEEVLGRAAALGYDGIELAPFTLTDDLWSYPVTTQRDLGRITAELGIEIMGLHWLLREQDGLHVTSPDAGVRGRTADFVRKLIEIAINTGAKVLTLGSPAQRSYEPPDTREDATERFEDLLRSLLPDLEAAGLILSLEPLETEYTNFITSTVEARRIADTVDSRAVGITLDTHFLRWEDEAHGVSIRRAFEIAGERLSHIHVQDDNSRAPGMGEWDFTELFSTLRDMDWTGYVSIETFVSETPEEADEVARRGIEFLRRPRPTRG